MQALSRALSGLAMLALGACTTPGIGQPIRTAGLAVASVDATGRVTAQAEGCAVFDANGRNCARPLRTDSLIRVASISKLVATIGVMRLVEQGRLDLDRDVGTYLGYPVRNPGFADRPISLRQLLSHTSSVIDGEDYALPLGQTLAAVISLPAHWDTGHAPGTHFTYANFNLVIVATVMERVTHERFDQLMQRLVLKPLRIEGCYNWATCPDSAVLKAAALYRTGEDETDWHADGPWVAQVDDLQGKRPDCPVRRSDPARPCNIEAYVPGTNGALFSPQGGLRVSVTGLAKIAGLMLGEGRLGRVRLLKPSSAQQMLAPQWQFDPASPNGETEKASMCAYGLSVQLTSRVPDPACLDDVFGDGVLREGHLGEAYGLFGGIWLDRRGKRASVYLVTGTNQDPRRAPGAHSAFTGIEEEAAARSKSLARP